MWHRGLGWVIERGREEEKKEKEEGVSRRKLLHMMDKQGYG